MDRIVRPTPAGRSRVVNAAFYTDVTSVAGVRQRFADARAAVSSIAAKSTEAANPVNTPMVFEMRLPWVLKRITLPPIRYMRSSNIPDGDPRKARHFEREQRNFRHQWNSQTDNDHGSVNQSSGVPHRRDILTDSEIVSPGNRRIVDNDNTERHGETSRHSNNEEEPIPSTSSPVVIALETSKTTPPIDPRLWKKRNVDLQVPEQWKIDLSLCREDSGESDDSHELIMEESQEPETRDTIKRMKTEDIPPTIPELLDEKVGNSVTLPFLEGKTSRPSIALNLNRFAAPIASTSGATTASSKNSPRECTLTPEIRKADSSVSDDEEERDKLTISIEKNCETSDASEAADRHKKPKITKDVTCLEGTLLDAVIHDKLAVSIEENCETSDASEAADSRKKPKITEDHACVEGTLLDSVKYKNLTVSIDENCETNDASEAADRHKEPEITKDLTCVEGTLLDEVKNPALEIAKKSLEIKEKKLFNNERTSNKLRRKYKEIFGDDFELSDNERNESKNILIGNKRRKDSRVSLDSGVSMSDLASEQSSEVSVTSYTDSYESKNLTDVVKCETGEIVIKTEKEQIAEPVGLSMPVICDTPTPEVDLPDSSTNYQEKSQPIVSSSSSIENTNLDSTNSSSNRKLTIFIAPVNKDGADAFLPMSLEIDVPKAQCDLKLRDQIIQTTEASENSAIAEEYDPEPSDIGNGEDEIEFSRLLRMNIDQACEISLQGNTISIQDQEVMETELQIDSSISDRIADCPKAIEVHSSVCENWSEIATIPSPVQDFNSVKDKEPRKRQNTEPEATSDIRHSLPKLRVLHPRELGARWCPTPFVEEKAEEAGGGIKKSLVDSPQEQPAVKSVIFGENRLIPDPIQSLNLLVKDKNELKIVPVIGISAADPVGPRLSPNTAIMYNNNNNNNVSINKNIPNIGVGTTTEYSIPPGPKNYSLNSLNTDASTISMPIVDETLSSMLKIFDCLLRLQWCINQTELPCALQNPIGLCKEFLARKNHLWIEFAKLSANMSTRDTRFVIDYIGKTYEYLVPLNERMFSMGEIEYIFRLNHLETRINSRLEKQRQLSKDCPCYQCSSILLNSPVGSPKLNNSSADDSLPAAQPLQATVRSSDNTINKRPVASLAPRKIPPTPIMTKEQYTLFSKQVLVYNKIQKWLQYELVEKPKQQLRQQQLEQQLQQQRLQQQQLQQQQFQQQQLQQQQQQQLQQQQLQKQRLQQQQQQQQLQPEQQLQAQQLQQQQYEQQLQQQFLQHLRQQVSSLSLPTKKPTAPTKAKRIRKKRVSPQQKPSNTGTENGAIEQIEKETPQPIQQNIETADLPIIPAASPSNSDRITPRTEPDDVRLMDVLQNFDNIYETRSEKAMSEGSTVSFPASPVTPLPIDTDCSKTDANITEETPTTADSSTLLIEETPTTADSSILLTEETPTAADSSILIEETPTTADSSILLIEETSTIATTAITTTFKEPIVVTIDDDDDDDDDDDKEKKNETDDVTIYPNFPVIENFKTEAIETFNILEVKSISKDVFNKIGDEINADFESAIRCQSSEEQEENMAEIKIELSDCFRCGAPSSVVCERCCLAFYCSFECHKAHWIETHHVTCKPVPVTTAAVKPSLRVE